MGVLAGTENGTWGAQMQNSKTTFQFKYTPLNPHLDTLGTILDPRKVIFSHDHHGCHGHHGHQCHLGRHGHDYIIVVMVVLVVMDGMIGHRGSSW